MTTLYEQRDAIVRLLDRNEWKHSWHLPRSGSGIDWWHPDTLAKVREQKADAIRQAIALIVLAESIQLPESDTNDFGSVLAEQATRGIGRANKVRRKS